MSYQYSSTTGSNRLSDFVPTYVPKSDYLPTRVIDSNQGEANKWVPIHLNSSPPTIGKREMARSTPRDPPNSIPTGTSPSRPPRTSL